MRPDELSTYAILRSYLPIYLGVQRRAVARRPILGCAGCRIGIGCGGGCYAAALGADEPPGFADSILARVDSAIARASDAASYAASRPGAWASSAAGWARGELLAAQRDLETAYDRAMAAGNRNAAMLIDTLSGRVRSALGDLGGGVGDAFRSIWGFSVGEVAGGAALLIAGVFLAVMLSGGGQAYLGSLGAGAGSAVASVGRAYETAIPEAVRGGYAMTGDVFKAAIKLV